VLRRTRHVDGFWIGAHRFRSCVGPGADLGRRRSRNAAGSRPRPAMAIMLLQKLAAAL